MGVADRRAVVVPDVVQEAEVAEALVVLLVQMVATSCRSYYRTCLQRTLVYHNYYRRAYDIKPNELIGINKIL